MAASSAARVLRVPGRLLINPVDQFYGDPQWPYGGTPVGAAQMCVVQPQETTYEVTYECWGEVGDIIEGGSLYQFVCILRGWDDDALRLLMQDGYSEGEITQHSVFSAPGNREAGTSSLARGVRLAYVPDDINHAPGIVAYNAVPDWNPGETMAMQRAAEFGLPVVFRLLRDSGDRIFAMGRMADLSPI